MRATCIPRSLHRCYGTVRPVLLAESAPMGKIQCRTALVAPVYSSTMRPNSGSESGSLMLPLTTIFRVCVLMHPSAVLDMTKSTVDSIGAFSDRLIASSPVGNAVKDFGPENSQSWMKCTAIQVRRHNTTSAGGESHGGAHHKVKGRHKAAASAGTAQATFPATTVC